MKELRSDYSSVGSYEKTEDNVQYFADGDFCWDTHEKKKATLQLICWDKEILISLKEVQKGIYYGIFATSAACNSSKDLLKPFKELDPDRLMETIQRLETPLNSK